MGTRDRLVVRTTDYNTAILARDQIGETRALTPEGFLLCTNVPIARAGWMVYGPGETPISTGTDGSAHVYRDTTDLFSELCIASFNGKPVVDDHPEDGEDVLPINYRDLTVGVCMNVRPGEGENADCLVADLLIMDQDVINAVNSGKREVSCGYDAGYEQTGEGTGKQHNIVGNHVALVERGRCGPRCAIGDHDTTTGKEHTMAGAAKTAKPRTRVQPTAEAVQRIFRDAESAALEAMGVTDPEDPGDPGGDDGIHIHLHGGMPGAPPGAAGATDEPGAVDPKDPGVRLTALEAAVQKILAMLGGDGGAGAGGGDTDPPPAKGAVPGDDPPPAKKKEPDPTLDAMDPDEEAGTKVTTGDSAAMQTVFQEVCAQAEILAPGLQVPTFDAKVVRKTTVDQLCGLRRRALDVCGATVGGNALLVSVNGGKQPALADMDCKAVATLFRAGAGAKKMLNNAAATHDASKLPGGGGGEGDRYKPKIQSIADINKFNAERWGQQA